MSVKETIGLLLLVIAFGIAPLFYFIGPSWGWIALTSGGAGIGFICFDRIARRRRATSPSSSMSNAYDD